MCRPNYFSIIVQLPELDYNRLKGHKQYRCAYLFLSAITSGYVWQEGDIGVLKVSASSYQYNNSERGSVKVT